MIRGMIFALLVFSAGYVVGRLIDGVICAAPVPDAIEIMPRDKAMPKYHT